VADLNRATKLPKYNDMSNEKQNSENQQGHAPLAGVSSLFSDGYSEEWKLKTQAARLRSMIDSGYGRTNKPIPEKRLLKLKHKLEEIEATLNGC